MICFRIRRSLFIHAHEPLRGLPRLLVDYHLNRCPACRAQWECWSREGNDLRRALQAEPELNGSAGKLRGAVAAQISAIPAAGHRVAGRTRQVGSRRRPRLAVLLAAALLALVVNAVAAFGPSLAAGARRLWRHVARHVVIFCDQVPKVNRTPPGGTGNRPKGPGGPR